MPRCPPCGVDYDAGERFCPIHGVRLVVIEDASRETQPLPVDPLLGVVLDERYRIDELIGAGGMGVVYRATHLLMERRVAVKVLRAQLAADELAARRFHREAKSASRLDHPACIRVADFGRTSGGLLYLVMELLEGETLAEALRTAWIIAPARAVAIAGQIAAALAHAHGVGLVHRDLKPDNVFLLRRGGDEVVKVVDFGLAKLLERDDASATLTQAGTVFGTPEYMSPEQAAGLPLGPASDLYALGIVLYQMLSGSLPFEDPSFVGVLGKHLSEPPPPLTGGAGGELPAPLVALVMRLLAKDPAARFASAEALARELADLDLPAEAPRAASRPMVPARVAAAPTMDVLAAMEAGKPDPAPRRRIGWPLRLGGIALGAVVIGIVVASTSTSTPTRTRTSTSTPTSTSTSTSTPTSTATSPPPAPVPPSPADAHLADADLQARAGNRIKERYHLIQALKAAPAHPAALYRLGAALVDDGELTLGCARLRAAASVPDPDPRAAPLVARACTSDRGGSDRPAR